MTNNRNNNDNNNSTVKSVFVPHCKINILKSKKRSDKKQNFFR